MDGELFSRFEFGKRMGSTILEISNGEREVPINVREETEKDYEGRALFLDPDEIDMFIAVLKLYKSKIVSPRQMEE